MVYDCKSCYGSNNVTNYSSTSTYNPKNLLDYFSRTTHNKYEINQNQKIELFKNTDITDKFYNSETNTLFINQDKTPQIDNIKFEYKPIPTKQSYAFKMYI